MHCFTRPCCCACEELSAESPDTEVQEKPQRSRDRAEEGRRKRQYYKEKRNGGDVLVIIDNEEESGAASKNRGRRHSDRSEDRRERKREHRKRRHEDHKSHRGKGHEEHRDHKSRKQRDDPKQVEREDRKHRHEDRDKRAKPNDHGDKRPKQTHGIESDTKSDKKEGHESKSLRQTSQATLPKVQEKMPKDVNRAALDGKTVLFYAAAWADAERVDPELQRDVFALEGETPHKWVWLNIQNRGLRQHANDSRSSILYPLLDMHNHAQADVCSHQI